MNTQLSQLGPVITRTGLGIVIIAHSLYLKVFVFTLPGTAAYFASIGLPQALAYVVFALEAICGVALIAGYRVRLAAAVLVPILLGATGAHWSFGWLFTNTGGGWEYPLFLAWIALAQVFLGPGHVKVSQRQASAAPTLTHADA